MHAAAAAAAVKYRITVCKCCFDPLFNTAPHAARQRGSPSAYTGEKLWHVERALPRWTGTEPAQLRMEQLS